MKNLPSISFLFLILLACSAPSKTVKPDREATLPGNTSPFFSSASFEKALYKSTLDIREEHLSGFIMLKKVADTSYRIVFASEIGMTLFDLGFHQGTFIVYYIFEPLNKKTLVRILEKDFRQLIFGTESGKSNPITKTIVQTDTVSGHIPGEIRVTNPGIKMTMNMRLMHQQE